MLHFRFFLSHDHSEKYNYFMKILRKFHTKIALNHCALHYFRMLLLMTPLVKNRETGVKCYVTCVKFMKWLYERANNVIKNVYVRANLTLGESVADFHRAKIRLSQCKAAYSNTHLSPGNEKNFVDSTLAISVFPISSFTAQENPLCTFLKLF